MLVVCQISFCKTTRCKKCFELANRRTSTSANPTANPMPFIIPSLLIHCMFNYNGLTPFQILATPNVNSSNPFPGNMNPASSTIFANSS